MKHTDTKQINVGGVLIGGGAPIPVQSMCNTRTSDAKATIDQIKRLYAAGCEIIRLAVPDSEAAEALPGRAQHDERPPIIVFDHDHPSSIMGMRFPPRGCGKESGEWRVKRSLWQNLNASPEFQVVVLILFSI